METNTTPGYVANDPSLYPAMPARPTFLTVLCILTFIASAWGIYKGINGYYTANTAAQMITDTQASVQEKMGDQPQPAAVKNMLGSIFSSMSADNIRKSSLITLISSIFTLIGALMMWGLRRMGFYVYIAGTVIAIIGPMVIFGSGLMGMISGGVTAFIGILFIILYGVNMKYLVR